MSVAIIPDFVKYQIEWLTSHKDLEFEPVIEDAIVKMLKDTGKSFIDEQPDETSQFDHIAESDRKVSISCAHENDVISREAAIEALARMMPRSYTPDGSHPADEEIFRAQEVFADCIEALEILPSAQPATNCSEIPNGSDDTISRRAAIDALWKALYEYEDETEKQFLESEELDVGEWIGHRIFVQNMNDIDRQTILNLPSAQPEQKTDEWIPISKETNPTKSGWYLVTVHEDATNENKRFTEMAEFNTTNGMWYDIDEPTDMYLRWMPLPEPYRGGEKET